MAYPTPGRNSTPPATAAYIWMKEHIGPYPADILAVMGLAFPTVILGSLLLAIAALWIRAMIWVVS